MVSFESGVQKEKKKSLFPPPCPRDETSLDSSGQFGLISAVWRLWWGKGQRGSEDRPQLPPGPAGPLLALEAEAEIGVIHPRPGSWRERLGSATLSLLYVDLLAPSSPSLLSAPPTCLLSPRDLVSLSVISSQFFSHQKLLFLGVTFQKSCRCPEVQPCGGGSGKPFLN